MTDNTQPEALMQLADDYAEASFDQGLHKRTLDDAPENARSVLAAAVRRQHARIAELEAARFAYASEFKPNSDGDPDVGNIHTNIRAMKAQLESIGAGGVSGPLMGKPQAMPDLSALTERGAKAWAGVDAQGLRDGVTSVAASAPAPSGHIKEPYTVAEIKAKIASNDYSAELLLQHAMLHLDRLAASAGSEPVAVDGWLHENGLLYRLTDERHPCNRDEINVTMADGSRSIESRSRRALELLDRIRAARPSPPEGTVGGWIALPGALPEPGTPVLLDIGKEYPIRAMWAAKHTVQACDDDTDWGEYVEEDDMYYAPEGWYEWNQCEDNHWRVTETPRAWAPLPPTTSAGSGKGE